MIMFFNQNFYAYTDASENADMMLKSIEMTHRSVFFSLESPFAFKADLIRVGHNNFVFYWSIHHILVDGWSCSILLKELAHTL